MKIAPMTNNYKQIMLGPISIERLAAGLRELGHEETIFAPTYANSNQLFQMEKKVVVYIFI